MCTSGDAHSHRCSPPSNKLGSKLDPSSNQCRSKNAATDSQASGGCLGAIAIVLCQGGRPASGAARIAATQPRWDAAAR